MFDRLPEYPWQQLKPYSALAAEHPDGAVDLSVGSPVDPTPKVIQDALIAGAHSPAYPTTAGSLELREPIADWFARRRAVPGLSADNVMTSIGSKELISLLPLYLGLGPDDVVVQPKAAYTAYAVGAAFAGAQLVSEDDPDNWPANAKLIWINSPGNPDGKVHDVAFLRKCLAKARSIGALLASNVFEIVAGDLSVVDVLSAAVELHSAAARLAAEGGPIGALDVAESVREIVRRHLA